MRAILLFVFLALIVFLVALNLGQERGGANVVHLEFALTWTMRLLGGLIALTATFALFLRSLGSEPLERQFGFVLPILGGVLLVGGHWSAALALGAIGVALICREGMLRAARRREDSDVSVPPV